MTVIEFKRIQIRKMIKSKGHTISEVARRLNTSPQNLGQSLKTLKTMKSLEALETKINKVI